MTYKIKIKRSNETTYFVKKLNLFNNYNNTKLKKKIIIVINVFSSFYVILLYK